MNTPAADGLFQKGIIESGVYEAKVYQKEDGDGTAIVKALLKELNLDESEVEKLETIPYYELSNAYNKVEAEVAAKGCYIGQGPMENGWFRGNPIKCGFTDHAKTIPVLAGTNIGEFDFGPVVPGKDVYKRQDDAERRRNVCLYGCCTFCLRSADYVFSDAGSRRFCPVRRKRCGSS